MLSPLITPFLWFNGTAEEAARFYVSLFPESRILDEMRSPVDTPGAPAGSVLTIDFELAGQHVTGLNAGPHYPFTPAFSFVIHCEDQAEIDYYWSALTEGGRESQCGWLIDRFGLSWQVVPRYLAELLRPAKAMKAMMGMNKLSVPELKAAAQS